MAVTLDAPYELNPQVSLRPEAFGALAYHFGNRRLTFLRSPDMVRLCEVLGDHDTLGAALAATGIDEQRWPSFAKALTLLEASETIRAADASMSRLGAPVLTTQPQRPARQQLTDDLKAGLDAPICLTWELTYACNLACVHCLSSSGRRDPRELTTEECFAVVDELERIQVFYVNIGGGEPMIRKDFFDIVDYSTAHHVGVKFSTNGAYIDAAAARRLAVDGLPRRAALDRRRHGGGQRPRPWQRLVRRGPRRHGPPRRRRLRRRSRSASS